MSGLTVTTDVCNGRRVSRPVTPSHSQPRPAGSGPYVVSVDEAARLCGVSDRAFRRLEVVEDGRVVGWRIPYGDDSTVLVPAVYITSRPRVPLLRLQQALGAQS